jgi:hypothetical protein
MLDAGLLSLFTDGKTQLSGLDPILILTAAACSMPQQEPQERERERAETARTAPLPSDDTEAPHKGKT